MKGPTSMEPIDRRTFLSIGALAASTAVLPASIRTALAIPAHVRTGTIKDVEHVVILMQENRSFDHYFGTLPGVRGFGDRLTIPLPGGRSVWEQQTADRMTILPYRLDSTKGNAQRVTGTPHSWADAQGAWNNGATGVWPQFKQPQSMGYYGQQELAFQFALAQAFTICDAYHCAIHSSTNPNRLFLFTGTNDPLAAHGGPAITNHNEDLGPPEQGYTWTTYPERLEAAGISWKVYQDMADNFLDNSLAGFRQFREAYYDNPASPLVQKGLSTTLTNNNLEGLKQDVLAGSLPQVSYVVAPSTYSEHPSTSSPVQGGWYTQEVLEALTADPKVWSKTVLLVMFDENDGFFDHVPPPCAPSLNPDGSTAGACTVDVATERHLDGRVYGPGPRVPMYVVSPWSRGGWVNSHSFDHTSIIRFLEACFGVKEPNISAYRRTFLGDLTTCFNFRNPNDEPLPRLPELSQAQADGIRAAQETLPQISPPLGNAGVLPVQPKGIRPSRALPYRLRVSSAVERESQRIRLRFQNEGREGAVFQVYDQLNLQAVPRRYAVSAERTLDDVWSTAGAADARYDLAVFGPNGFYRLFQGKVSGAAENVSLPEITVSEESDALRVILRNAGDTGCTFIIESREYGYPRAIRVPISAGGEKSQRLNLARSGRWYDFTISVDDGSAFVRRFAGRIENGQHSVTDPAMGQAPSLP
jgi:phospholipase C